MVCPIHCTLPAVKLNPKLLAVPVAGGSTIVIVPPFTVPKGDFTSNKTVPLATLPVAEPELFPSTVIIPPLWLKVAPATITTFPFTITFPPETVSVPPATFNVESNVPALLTVSVFAATVKLPELMVSCLTEALPGSVIAEAFWITKLSALLIEPGDVPVPSVLVPHEATSVKSVAEALE